VLVSGLAHTQNVKKIVEQLERRGGTLHVSHPQMDEPWGTREILERCGAFQLSRLTLRPGAELAATPDRDCIWTVLDGTARATIGGETFALTMGQSAKFAAGQFGRLHNSSDTPLAVIEILNNACGA